MTHTTTRADWLIPAALLALTVVPLLGGVVRLVSLATGLDLMPEQARFAAAPVPVILHIVGAVTFCAIGAFQFAPGFRRANLARHRMAGRVLVGAGIIAALSALWMTLFYPRAATDGDLVYWFRLLAGSGMLAGLILGLAAILRRDIPTHRAWMIRAYALAQGAGMQVFTFMPWFIFMGNPTGLTRDLLMGAGWGINIIFAEWIIRRKSVGRRVAVA